MNQHQVLSNLNDRIEHKSNLCHQCILSSALLLLLSNFKNFLVLTFWNSLALTMLNSAVISSQNYYHPLGDSPPVCLTQDLPPEGDADILCMGCGDARNVLFTCFVDASRKIDVTCVDTEPGILARNVLLYALLIDDKANLNVERIFNIYYHWKLDRGSADLLEKQVSKLLPVSISLDKWHASAYGCFIRFCDARSLSQVRAFWLGFRLKGISPAQRKERLMKLQCAINKAKTRHDMRGHNVADHHSASLIGTQVRKDLSDIAKHWWNTGTTSSAYNVTDLNPAFLFLPNEALMLHYNLSPLSGFPADTAYISIAEESVFHIKRHKGMSSSRYLVNSAKIHLKEWAAAFRRAVGNKSIIRIFCGDALAFGCTLHNCQSTGATSMNLFCDNLTSNPLTLSNDYGNDKNVPVSFDVIDASNLADHLGPLNVIGVASSLLKYHASSSLYAEVSLKWNANPNKKSSSVEQDANLSHQFTGFFGVDERTMSLLFGLVLPELFTNASCNLEDVSALDKFPKMAKDPKATQVCTRLRWKRLRGCKEPCNVPFIQVSAKALAKLLIQVHNAMFSVQEEDEDDDDDDSDDDMFSFLAKFFRSRRRRPALYKHVVRYSRASFAFFLNRVQATVVSDWNECFKYIHQKCLKSGSWADVMSDFVQDLLLNLHLFGVDNGTFIKSACSEMHSAVLAPILPISETGDVPDLLCVTVRVPKKKLGQVEPVEFGAPAIVCCLEEEEDDEVSWSSMFSSVHIVFGKWHAKTSKNQHSHFEEDPTGLCGESDMYASFMVPTWVLLESKRNVPWVTCEMMPNESEYSCPYLMRSKMTGTDVLVTRFMPGMSALPTFTRPNNCKPTSATTTIQCTYGDGSKINMLTRRVAIDCPTVKTKLADKSSTVNVKIQSPLTAVIDIAGTEQLKFELPLPLSFSKAVIKVARASSYVEVESPLFDPLQEDASAFMFPMVIADGSTVPTLWTFTRINLDVMPPMDSKDNQAVSALTTQALLMFSNRERLILENGKSDARTALKSTLVSLFKEFTSGKVDIFNLTKMNGDIQMLIFPSCLRMDLVNRTLVLDAAIVPLKDAMLSDERLKSFLEELTKHKVHEIKVSAAVNQAWKAVMPAMVERCRAWKHNADCEYLSEERATPICSCGVGQFPPEDYLKSQTENIPELSFLVSSYATRVAIAPVFAVPYVEEYLRESEVNNNDVNKSSGKSDVAPKEKCERCSRDDRELKQCARCKKVRYCSKACKKADSRKHKHRCRAA